MKAFKYGLLVVFLGAIASIVLGAEEQAKMAAGEHKLIDPAKIEWGDGPPGLPQGAKLAVLWGDPAQKGVFTLRLNFPAGYRIMPHTHSSAEIVTVISGTLNMGTGPKFDESAGHKMPAGTLMAMPAGTQHFAWASEETVIQVHGEGPFKIVYVNPEDDPRNAKK